MEYEIIIIIIIIIIRYQDLIQLLYCGFLSCELMYSGKWILMIGGALSQYQ